MFYELSFLLLMDQLGNTKSCFCKARGKNALGNPEVRPGMVRVPQGSGREVMAVPALVNIKLFPKNETLNIYQS